MSPLDSNNPGVVVQKPKSDVYTTMLFLALIAIIIACLCLFLEMRAYNNDIKANEARIGALRPDARFQNLAAENTRGTVQDALALDS